MTYAKKLIYQAFKASDLAAMALALFFIAGVETAWIHNFSALDFLSVRFTLTNILGLILLCLLYIFIFFQFGLYQPRFMPHHFKNDFFSISKASGLNTLVLTTVGSLLNISMFNTAIMLFVFYPTIVFLTIFQRYIVWHILKRVHLGDKNQRNILIVGTNKDAIHYGKMIEEVKDLGYKFLGYIDDEIIDSEAESKYLGKVKHFEKLLKDKKVIDEIIICTTIGKAFKMAEPIITQAHAQGIIVRLPLANIFKPIFKESDILRTSCERAIIAPSGETAPELIIHSGFQIGWNFVVKRVFDLVVATTLLILTFPILLITALIIRSTSSGAALFLQERHGYNGRIFKLYKFRSMVKDADDMQAKLRETSNEMDGAAFKIKNDPRITKVGKFIRKTSIDELPQLLNVILGDISLVGPRPLPLADYENFTEISHLRRLSVLPGITGSWQVSGRSDLSFEEWMKLDLDYIDNWSFRSDMKILFKTIPAVLKGSGAS
jgi:exopolysaccharide biosynthesis polyprenyl glycosylphosphotransferase